MKVTYVLSIVAPLDRHTQAADGFHDLNEGAISIFCDEFKLPVLTGSGEITKRMEESVFSLVSLLMLPTLFWHLLPLQTPGV